MMLMILLLIAAPQQLTWYESYEEGEKAFEARNYQMVIETMTAAVADQPEPKKNKFTRAIQKINYKPYYYRARAYYELGELNAAYEDAKRAFDGEVVSDTPRLQADLLVIFDAYRDYINQENTRLLSQRSINEKRGALLKLITSKQYQQAQETLADVDENELELYADLKALLDQQLDYEAGLANTKSDLKGRIESDIDQGFTANARLYINSFRDLFSTEELNAFEALIRKTETRLAREAAQAGTDAEATPPQPDQELTKELEDYKKRVADLESESGEFESKLTNLNTRNEELRSKLVDQAKSPKTVAPLPVAFLELNQSGIKGLRVAGESVIPAGLESWRLELNGKPADVPEAAVSDSEPLNLKIDTQLQIPAYGAHNVRLVVIDALQRETSVTKKITLVRPWFLAPPLWWGLAALVLAGLMGTGLMRIRRKRKAALQNFNPYIAGSPVLQKEMFFGRNKLLDRIQGMVHRNCLMIYGERRIGKTSILYQLKQNLASIETGDYRFLPVFIDLQGIQEDDLFHHMMEEIIYQYRDRLGDVKDGLEFSEENKSYRNRHFSKDLKRIIEQLAKDEPKHIIIVLLMDEVDIINEFSEKTNQKLRGIFMKDFAEHLSCIMAGIHLKKSWESSGSPWYNFFEEIPMTAIADEAARDLILSPVKGIFTYDNDAVELIINNTGGQPYLIQKICVSLINSKLADGRFRITKADVGNTIANMKEETKIIQGVG